MNMDHNWFFIDMDIKNMMYRMCDPKKDLLLVTGGVAVIMVDEPFRALLL